MPRRDSKGRFVSGRRHHHRRRRRNPAMLALAGKAGAAKALAGAAKVARVIVVR